MKIPSGSASSQNAVFALDQEKRRAERDQADQRDLHHPLRAHDVIGPGEDRRAQPGGDVERDPELYDLLDRHVERAGGIDAAEGEHGVHPVHIEQPGGEEAGDIGVGADRADGLDQGAEPGAHRLAGTNPGRRAVGDGEEQGQPRRPRTQSATIGPTIRTCSGRLLVEAEGRPLGLDEEKEREGEGRTAPPYSRAPNSIPKSARRGTAARSPAASRCRRPPPSRSRYCEDEEAERPENEAGIGGGEPEQRRRRDGERGEGAEPRLALAGLIGRSPRKPARPPRPATPRSPARAPTARCPTSCRRRPRGAK